MNFTDVIVLLRIKYLKIFEDIKIHLIFGKIQKLKFSRKLNKIVQPWLYRRVIDRIVAFWLIFPIALLQKVFRVKFYASGDGFNYMDRTLIIMNHRTRVDWMLFWPLLFHCARLRKLKILLKSDLKYIPGPGWYVFSKKIFQKFF